jgi:hypothetical protein
MRRTFVTVFAAFLFFATAAHAGSIPTYNLTSGTVFVTSNLFTGTVDFSFNGPGGVSLSGLSTMLNSCGFIVAGDPTQGQCFPGASTQGNESDDFAGATLGGIGYSVTGGINISGSPITLPVTFDPTFFITVPVTFSGTYSVCPLPANVQSCSFPAIALLSVNGTGTGQLIFTQIGFNGVSIWQLTSATYTLSPVPEPSSLILLGTGASALFGFARKKILGGGK